VQIILLSFMTSKHIRTNFILYTTMHHIKEGPRE